MRTRAFSVVGPEVVVLVSSVKMSRSGGVSVPRAAKSLHTGITACCQHSEIMVLGSAGDSELGWQPHLVPPPPPPERAHAGFWSVCVCVCVLVSVRLGSTPGESTNGRSSEPHSLAWRQLSELFSRKPISSLGLCSRQGHGVPVSIRRCAGGRGERDPGCALSSRFADAWATCVCVCVGGRGGSPRYLGR